MTLDNDWKIPVRVLTEEEASEFPATGETVFPPDEDDLDLFKQVEDEKANGHPAYDEVEPDYEPVDLTVDED